MRTESATEVLAVQPNREMHKELFFRNTNPSKPGKGVFLWIMRKEWIKKKTAEK